MMSEGRVVVVKAIKRVCNYVSHHSAQMGRHEGTIAVWLRSDTERVVNLCGLDWRGPD